jgi:hypothetical protein
MLYLQPTSPAGTIAEMKQPVCPLSACSSICEVACVSVLDPASRESISGHRLGAGWAKVQGDPYPRPTSFKKSGKYDGVHGREVARREYFLWATACDEICYSRLRSCRCEAPVEGSFWASSTAVEPWCVADHLINTNHISALSVNAYASCSMVCYLTICYACCASGKALSLRLHVCPSSSPDEVTTAGADPTA